MGSSGIRVEEALARIQSEYAELPGLRLTRAQVERLWHLEQGVCEALLAALVDARFLSRTSDGQYVRHQADVDEA